MNIANFLIGAAAGSALMFVLDPSGGRRRRARVRDQVTRATRKTRDGLDATARDLANRAGGITAATRQRWSSGEVNDEKLSEVADAHDSAEGIPSLDIMQRKWAPATRAMVTAGLVATGVLMAMGVAREAGGSEAVQRDNWS